MKILGKKTIFCIISLISTMLLTTSCGNSIASPTTKDNNSGADRHYHDIPFAYYLQNIDFEGLKKLNAAVTVVDPYDSNLTKEQIKYLQDHYGQQIIAYISAGEVDPTRQNPDDGYHFRPEWKHASWITSIPDEVQSNDRWSTRRVAYWEQEWQDIMIKRTINAIRKGYNGVMLDTVDSFLALKEHVDRDVRQDMADMIGAIRDIAKSINPDFKIMINGGMELYKTKYSKTGEPFLKLIDGQLKEDSWYNECGEINQPWTKYDMAYIKQAIDANIPVYNIDYFTGPAEDTKEYCGKICEGDTCKSSRRDMESYMKKALEFGVIPYAADRMLGKLLPFNKEYFSRSDVRRYMSQKRLLSPKL